MVLLTSSQVSVLISSAIALFLSGYVIQQRTLNQLREAIKPESRPSPKASYYVPDHLKDVTAEKQEQIIIEVNPTVPERQQQQQQQQQKQKAGQKAAGWTSDMWQKMMAPSDEEENGGVSKEDLEKMGERERNIEGWKVKDQKNPDPEASNQKPISRAERRRLIKEELKRLAESEERVYYQRRLW
ncbi:uncharacterized protein ColSpa_02708 [Colletotrichum spaethianum]|uniref:Uncharacterized protein n=1 Tax=Colletotrichum spaethianum TaxID=700344 RepID=A0AA37L635_9PEZI|nr:uncharacterized protein ColSpa_02708 [Colletotrichum spaethianum]GKT42527.1 hypothetical protein ColSpa_02708 [Colletotrichum spaethianum]